MRGKTLSTVNGVVIESSNHNHKQFIGNFYYTIKKGPSLKAFVVVVVVYDRYDIRFQTYTGKTGRSVCLRG